MTRVDPSWPGPDGSRADVLAAGPDPVDRGRRRRLLFAAAVLVAVGVAVAVRPLSSGPAPAPRSPVSPSPLVRGAGETSSDSPTVAPPHLGHVTVASRPLLTADDLARLVGVRAWHPIDRALPGWDATCAGRPTTWHAAHVASARYVVSRKANIGDDAEWLLRYPDAASARRAVTRATQACPGYTELNPTSGFPAVSVTQPNDTGDYEGVFAVGRDGSVVVVLSTESFGSPPSRALAYALQRAIPSEARRCVQDASTDPDLRPLCLMASQAPPSAPPLRLRADPLRTEFGPVLGTSAAAIPAELVRLGVRPSVLSGCIGDPTRLGAAQTWGAAYGNPTTEITYSEYVLSFADAGSAHAALVRLWRDAVRCSTPGGEELGPPGGDWTAASRQDAAQIDEAFAGQWGSPTLYAIRVGRSDNVLFVIQDLGEPDDRAGYVLGLALAAALSTSS